MTMRRVVTGHKEGKAVFVADGVPSKIDVFKKTPGLESSIVWATSAKTQIAASGEADPVSADTPILPRQSETRLVYLQIPPHQ